jgi:hypothetical protein
MEQAAEQQQAVSSTNKRNWTPDEDAHLLGLVDKYTINKKIKFSKISKAYGEAFGPQRTGGQCSQRWLNHVDPDLDPGAFRDDEDEIICSEIKRQDKNDWAAIAKLLPGRSSNHVKNRWNGSLKIAVAEAKEKLGDRYDEHSKASAPTQLRHAEAKEKLGDQYDEHSELSAR